MSSRKKVATFFLIIALIAPAVPVAVPRAHAIPVSVVVNVDRIQSIFDGIGWAIAKAMIRSITQSVVVWINSGFEGSPLFVTNMRAHLLGLADAKAREFLDQIEITGSIDSPHLSSIGRVLREGYLRATAAQAYFQQNQYTLDRYCTDPEAFRRGNFSEGGGFRCWNAAWNNPANNPFLSFYSAEQELQRRIRIAVQDRQTELNWGRGFISWRGNCEASSGGEGDAATLSAHEETHSCPVRTPGGVIEEQLVHVLGSDVRQLEIADSINEIVAALAGQLVNQVVGGGLGLLGLGDSSSGGGRSFISDVGSPGRTNEQAFEVTLRTAEIQLPLFKQSWETIRDAAQAAHDACEDNGSYRILTGAQIEQTLSRARNEVIKADAALVALADLRQRFTTAQQTADAQERSALSAAIVREYERLLQERTIPTDQDFQYAVYQSQSVSTDSPETLYDKMKKHEETCS